MTSKEDCINSALKASDGVLDRAGAEDLVNELLQRKKSIAAQAKLSSPEVVSHVAQGFLRNIDTEQRKKAMQKRHAALNIVRRQELDGFVRAAEEAGESFEDILLALCVGSHKDIIMSYTFRNT